MFAVKLLQNYDGIAAGEAIELTSAEDAQRLIDSGIAEPIASDTAEQKLVDKVCQQVRSGLKSEGTKLFATARDHDREDVGPYHNFGQFAKAVIGASTGNPSQEFLNWNAQRGEKVSGMSEGLDADGGFLIPTEYSNALLAAISKESVIASRCLNFPSSHNLSMPYLARGSQATSYTGGMRTYKPAEGVAKTASKPALAKLNLKLHKMAIVVYATDELLADTGLALQTFLTTCAATEFAETKDEDVIFGSGAGEALGVLNSPCVVSQAKESTQNVGSGTIVTENLVNMYARMYPRSLGNAIWLANSDCMPQLATCTLNVGTGGAPVGLLQPLSTGGLSSKPLMGILGQPLVLTSHCMTCGTTGDIIFGDFTQYVTISKSGQGAMDVNTSIHLKFLEDETAFRFVVRFDGQPWWNAAITPKHSALTQSPFVKLATR